MAFREMADKMQAKFSLPNCKLLQKALGLLPPCELNGNFYKSATRVVVLYTFELKAWDLPADDMMRTRHRSF